MIQKHLLNAQIQRMMSMRILITITQQEKKILIVFDDTIAESFNQ